MRHVRGKLNLKTAAHGAWLLLGSVLCASSAHAAGLEDTVGGTVGLGRAAYFARVNDFMATLQNPANLAVIPKNDLGLELRLPMLKACYDRARNPLLEYKQDEQGNLVESFGVECNQAGAGPTANVGWAQSYDSGLGWGVGLFTPAASGNSKYGNDVNRTLYPLDTEPYMPTNTGIQSPTRQLGIEREGVVAYLMAGVGYQFARQLRVGASFGFGLASVYNKSMVSALGGTFNDQEVVNELRVNDYFVPRATVSGVWAASDSLDLFASFMYTGDIKAEGYADLTANGLKGVPRKSCYAAEPGSHCRLENVQLTVPQIPVELTFGVRYAKRHTARERVLDPMKDEDWDVELDVSWAQTSHVDQFGVRLHDKMPGSPGSPTIQFGNGMGASSSFLRNTTGIAKRWDDTWTVRLGGDWNVLPAKLSLRSGVSYASRATPLETMSIDYLPVQKLGLHFGASYAFSTYRVSLAYAHLFYQKVIVQVGDGEVKDIVTLEQQAATGVNEGRFTAGLNVLSLQVDARF